MTDAHFAAMQSRTVTWFVPMWLIEECKRRASWSMLGEDPFSEVGALLLYEKNTNTSWRFDNPRKHPSKFGFLADRDVVPAYFANVIHAADI